MAEAKIILYEHGNYGGESRGLTSDAPNLKSLGFDDKVSSIKVVNSVWQLCEHADHKGLQYVVGPGDYRNWEAWNGVNDQLSSVKKLKTYPENAITLYENTDFGGKNITFTEPAINVTDDFNDLTSSIKVISGTWILYKHGGFKGEQYVVTKGDYRSFKDWGGKNDEISSCKPAAL